MTDSELKEIAEGCVRYAPHSNMPEEEAAHEQAMGRLSSVLDNPETRERGLRSVVQLDDQLNPDFWAWQRLAELVRGDPEVAWRVVLTIYQLDSSDAVLGAVAAGPLEDLVVQHGQDFIDRIEVLSGQDAIFKKLLGGVWRSDIQQNVWDRLRAVMPRSTWLYMSSVIAMLE